MVFPTEENVMNDVGSFSKALRIFLTSYAAWMTKTQPDEKSEVEVNLDLDRAIEEYNRKRETSLNLIVRCVGIFFRNQTFRRCVVGVLILLNFISLAYTTWPKAFEEALSKPYYATGLIATCLSGFGLIFGGRIPQWGLWSLSVASATSNCLHHIFGVLNEKSTPSIEINISSSSVRTSDFCSMQSQKLNLTSVRTSVSSAFAMIKFLQFSGKSGFICWDPKRVSANSQIIHQFKQIVFLKCCKCEPDSDI